MKRLSIRSKKKTATPREDLDWFLEFINIPDIDSLPVWEFIRHNLNVSGFAFGLGLTDSNRIFSEKTKGLMDTPEIRARIKERQDYLRSSLESILQKRDELMREPLEVINEETGQFVPYFNLREYRVPFSAQISSDGEQIVILPPDSYSPEEYKSLLYHRLIEVLSNFDLSRIKICENGDCGKYFLQPTEKGKRYCSPRCTYRASTRGYREKNPEKSRRSARRANRKRYEKKVRERSGRNVKIQKRARKED